MNKLFNENYYKQKYLKYKSKYLYNKHILIGGTREQIRDEIYSLLKMNSDRILQSFLIGKIRVEPFSIPYTDNDQTIIEYIKQKVNPLLITKLTEWSVSSARFDLHLSVTDSHIEINLEIIPLYSCLILDNQREQKRIIKTDNCRILEEKLNLSQYKSKYQRLSNILRNHYTHNHGGIEIIIVTEDEYNLIDILNNMNLETLKLVMQFTKDN